MNDENSDNVNRPYPLLSRCIHWLTALIVLVLLFVGMYMTSMAYSPQKIEIYNLHKSFGLLVLFMAFLRILWLVIKGKPKSLPTHKKWEKGLSHLTHAFLYFALFAIPLSGWVMSSASEYPVYFFGFDLPDFVGKDKDLAHNAEEIHELLAFILLGFVGLHMAGAFKHHFIDKDATIKRMSSARLGLLGGILLLLVMGGLYALPASQLAKGIAKDLYKAEAQGNETAQEYKANQSDALSDNDEVMDAKEHAGVTEWDIDTDNSTLEFTATQYGSAFTGTFDFDGHIYFDPERLKQGDVRIEIDIKSIQTGSDSRDEQALSADWFDTDQYRYAVFTADQFEAGAQDNEYVAKGTLTIKGVSMPLDLPFILQINDDGGIRSAIMNAQISLSRADYKVGQGEWEGDDAIGHNVELNIELKAKAKSK